MKQLRRAFVALSIGAGVPLAHAAGWGAVLHDGPARDFNDEDIRLQVQAITKTLDAAPGAEPVKWRNEASGAGGSLQVLGQPSLDDQGECRRVRSQSYSRKRNGSAAVWTACKQPDGHWKLVSVG